MYEETFSYRKNSDNDAIDIKFEKQKKGFLPAFSCSYNISLFHFEMYTPVHYNEKIVCELSLLGVASLTSR